MADILGIRNLVLSGGTTALAVTYGNDVGILSSTTFNGQGRNLTADKKMEWDVFLDQLVGVNATDANLVYDGATWHTGGARTRMPIATFVKTVGSRMYLARLTYVGTDFLSRVWHTDDEGASNNTLKWGYETGTNLSQTGGSKVVQSANAGFKTYGIKTGDPFVITTGANADLYHVDSVDSDQQITLVEELKNTATNSTYWTGSHWFDVATNDGDTIQGLGENDNKLLIFKRESLYRYDTRENRKVKGAPGTTSHRSVINIRENTFYFHDTGIYRYDGISSFLISRPIQDWIDGIDATQQGNIVGWSDGDILYMFVGNVTNTPRGISVTNCVLIYDTAAQAWNIGSLTDTVKVATVAIESNTRSVYLGTDANRVLTWNSGNADISTPISWSASTIFHFPVKAYNVLELDRAEVHTIDGRGVSVMYKLYGVESIDQQWKPLGDINDTVTKLVFPRGNSCRGFAYKFLEISDRRPPIVSRIDTFYRLREQATVMKVE